MNEEPLKLCMLSGSFEYDSESSLTIFRDYIEREHPAKGDLIIYRSETTTDPSQPSTTPTSCLCSLDG